MYVCMRFVSFAMMTSAIVIATVIVLLLLVVVVPYVCMWFLMSQTYQHDMRLLLIGTEINSKILRTSNSLAVFIF